MSRRQFRSDLQLTDIRWTGTNKAEVDALFGDNWESTLVGHPLLIGNWLYRIDGESDIYIMSDRARNSHTFGEFDVPV